MNRSILVVLVAVALTVSAVAWMLLGGRSEGAAAGPAAAAERTEGALPAEPLTPSASSQPAEVAAVDRQAVEARAIDPASAAGATKTARNGLLVRGEVRDERGQAVSGAKVFGMSIENRMFVGSPLDAADLFGGLGARRLEAVTDAAGRFELEGAKPGNFRLAVRAARFLPLDDDDIVIPAGELHELEPIVLGASAIVEGRVIDRRGRAVAGAAIARRVETQSVGGLLVIEGLQSPTVPLATSGDDGSFVLDCLPSGTLTLAVTSEVHPDFTEKLELPAPGAVMRGHTIVLEDGFEISGRVSGMPKDDVREFGVTASLHRARESSAFFEMDSDGGESRQARVSADGAFVVRGLREGKRYDVSLRRAPRDEPMMFQPRMSTRVTATAGERGIELVYQPESSIVMTVIDAQSRKPIEEFDLRGGTEFPMPVMLDGRPQRRFPAGQARVENLRPNSSSSTASIEIDATGYQPFRMENIELVEGGEVDLGVIQLEPAPICRVTVLDASTGRPIGGARVTLSKVREPESSGGVNIRSAAIAVAGGAVHGEDEDLDLGDFAFGGDSERAGKTDVNGVVELSSFPGEKCEITVSHKTHARTRSEPFVCAVGMREEREVRMGEGGTARVTLVTADGLPIAGGKVESRAKPSGDGSDRSPFGGIVRAVTDAQGVAEFHHLSAGVHQFRREAGAGNGMFGGGNFVMRVDGMPDDGAAEWVEGAVTEGGTTEVRVVAPTLVVLTGKITEGGTPLSGASVSLSPRSEGDSGMRGMMFGGQSATADASGRYQIGDVKAGDYTLTVTHASRQMPAEFALSIGSIDKTFDVDLDIAVIEGKVVGPDGKPMQGVRVSAERDSGGTSTRRAVRMIVANSDDGGADVIGGDAGAESVRTDAEGRYALRGVLSGTPLKVKAEAKGFQPARSEVFEMAPNQIKRGVDLSMSVAGKLEVSAFQNGAPASMVVLNVFPEGTSPAHPDAKFSFIQSGKTTVDGLKPGKWTVQARMAAVGGPGAAGGAPTPMEQVVEVRADTTVPVRFDL